MINPNKRTVVIPCFSEAVDISTEAPLVDHPLFARLLTVGQLGAADKVFPGARHSRGEHSLGAYHRTKVLVRRLIAERMISPTQEYTLRVYALLHDIGHGPKSHAIESVTTRSHKENGVRLILGPLRDSIEALGVSPERLTSMMEKRDPLSAVVSDYNLGMEKIDYLERDAYHIGKRIGDTSMLSRYIIWEGGELGIDAEVIEDAKRLLLDYAYMYKQVYLRHRCLLYERMIGKMLAAELLAGLGEDDLWPLTDGELEGLLGRSEQNSELYRAYRNSAAPETVVVLRPSGTEEFEPPREDKLIVPVDPALFPDALAASEAHPLVSRVEREVGRLLGDDGRGVVVVPPLDKKRFRPRDIAIFERGRRRSLRERDPHAFADIERTYEQYAGLRICVVPRLKSDSANKMREISEVATAVLADWAKRYRAV